MIEDAACEGGQERERRSPPCFAKENPSPESAVTVKDNDAS